MKSYLISFILIVSSQTLGQSYSSQRASLKTAGLLERRGDIDGAIAIYKGILDNDPGHHSSIQKLKSIYMNYQRYDEGIKFLRGRLAKESNNIKIYAELGEFHYLNDQQKEAAAVWSKGLSKFKNNRSVYRIMTVSYTHLTLPTILRE